MKKHFNSTEISCSSPTARAHPPRPTSAKDLAIQALLQGLQSGDLPTPFPCYQMECYFEKELFPLLMHFRILIPTATSVVNVQGHP